MRTRSPIDASADGTVVIDHCPDSKPQRLKKKLGDNCSTGFRLTVPVAQVRTRIDEQLNINGTEKKMKQSIKIRAMLIVIRARRHVASLRHLPSPGPWDHSQQFYSDVFDSFDMNSRD